MEEIALMVGTTRQSISKWEKGQGSPGIYDFLKLCGIFNCELGYLLCEEGYTCKTRKTTDTQAAIAIAYEQLKVGAHKEQEYNIIDDSGKFVDFLCGDVDLLILQNRFTRFAINSSEALSLIASRREWAAKTDEEKADIIAQIELDLKKGDFVHWAAGI